MKKNNSLLLVAVVAAATIISSCSSEKGLTVEKRKYRTGYSVNWNNGKNEIKQEATVENKKTTGAEMLTEMQPANATVTNEVKSPEPLLTASAETSSPIITKPETDLKIAESNSATTVTVNQISESKSEPSTSAKKYTRADRKEMKKFLQHKAPGDTDIPLWAYILFAIILPPLAVGLFEGIHGPFWLSILLTLLFWIPGVIYAIWRVTRK